MLSETEVSWDKGLKIGNNERGRMGEGERQRKKERARLREFVCKGAQYKK